MSSKYTSRNRNTQAAGENVPGLRGHGLPYVPTLLPAVRSDVSSLDYCVSRPPSVEDTECSPLGRAKRTTVRTILMSRLGGSGVVHTVLPGLHASILLNPSPSAGEDVQLPGLRCHGHQLSRVRTLNLQTLKPCLSRDSTPKPESERERESAR